MSSTNLRQKAQVILNALGSPEAELSILIVDDPDIEVLNRRYLQRPGPTNVIAFPMQSGQFSHISPQLLGDVVISIDTAKRESAQGGMQLDRRLDQLLIHGILHLFGYDHVNDGHSAREMEEKSAELLQLVAGI